MTRSLAVTAVLAGTLALAACGGGSEPADTGSSPAPSSATTTAAAPGAAAVTYKGVGVGNATDLTKASNPTSSSSETPTKLEYKDLVVGKGKAASPTSTVNVQYEGVLYKDGTAFDSSWSRGQAASFSLTGVVPGFTQGIGGTDGVPPMKEGGRRIMILPAALGYGAQSVGSIPANSPLVFVVDLVSVS